MEPQQQIIFRLIALEQRQRKVDKLLTALAERLSEAKNIDPEVKKLLDEYLNMFKDG